MFSIPSLVPFFSLPFILFPALQDFSREWLYVMFGIPFLALLFLANFFFLAFFLELVVGVPDLGCLLHLSRDFPFLRLYFHFVALFFFVFLTLAVRVFSPLPPQGDRTVGPGSFRFRCPCPFFAISPFFSQGFSGLDPFFIFGPGNLHVSVVPTQVLGRLPPFF